ncbi:DUF5681 domain-containing protein [Chthonobacter rhizosphaerae]|uniref:DUF5681 domain-containing protein n=1 Tax=Chthonobacter rhizosphaerae TaxID=2735553 RepID=UPI0015EFB52A|nr:DUF5681 domain-containing protein [Chthonobacter rhizosphaerae]
MSEPITGNNAAATRGRPFAPGNPGRPKGSRNRTSLAVELLLEGEAEQLTRKAIDLALAGDTVALKLCIDRLAPPRKDRPVRFEIPASNALADVVQVADAVIRAVADGEVTPAEAASAMAVLEGYRRLRETAELEARVAALEAGAR